MSEWFFVGLAYGLTWVGMIGFAVYLGVRRRRALERLANIETETGGRP